MSITESVAAFKARATHLGLAEGALQLLIDGGIDAMSKYAFSSAYVPGQQDEAPFITALKTVMSRDPTVAELSVLRRLLHECYAMASASMKQIVEKSEDAPARKLSQPERADRLDRQQRRLRGVKIQGPYEPSDRLVDRLDKTFMLDPTGALKMKSKESSLEADTSSDLLLRQAFTRRSLGFDQANLIDFERHEEWAEKLFTARFREPPQGYCKVSHQQMLNADAQLFVRLAELTRSGIQAVATGRPLDAVWSQAVSDPDVLHLIQPMPTPPPSHKEHRSQPYGPTPRRLKGEGKGKKGGVLPLALKHGVANTKNGKPLCFDFNLGKCTRKVTRGACAKGLHLCCMKDCQKAGHHYLICPSKPSSPRNE